MPDPREVELIQRCQQGSGDAFRELFDRYQRRTYWIAHNMLSNYDTAQDISQEAFLRVFRNITRFDTKKNFYTWLYQIVVNLCIDHMRRASHSRATAWRMPGVSWQCGRRQPALHPPRPQPDWGPRSSSRKLTPTDTPPAQ